MGERLRGLWRWWTLVWQRYLDDLACLLVSDFELAANGREECDGWGR